ncbi:MAG TPA: endonuclease/exonuclease/phosphatase family protein, partial [Blastocatellia bacterium]|jgi:endonuclease/exonuclease/phosphatase family metal-dependent hydrolase
MREVKRFRVATYNIHKCVGIDRVLRPERIAEVLRELDADIVGLQEVLCVQGQENYDDQAHYLARELGMEFRLGENRQLRGGAYGNVVLSRFPMIAARNHDISVEGREQRGCLRVDIDLHSEQPLHIYNVHLGTSFVERRHQARKLLHEDVLKNNDHIGPRVLVGDFNEWTRGLASRLLHEHFQNADLRLHLGRARTYPGVLPFLHLDHIYFDESLELLEARLHRSRTALVASDHLPIVADFRVRHF